MLGALDPALKYTGTGYFHSYLLGGTITVPYFIHITSDIFFILNTYILMIIIFGFYMDYRYHSHAVLLSSRFDYVLKLESELGSGAG